MAVVLSLVSCNKEDLNPLASEVAGMWWKLIEQKGTLPENFGGADYTRIGNAVFLGETGSGYGVTFFFNDDEGDPIYVIGGESVAGLTYTTSVGGSIKLNFDKAHIEYADYYRNWTMTYSGGSITASDGKSGFTLDKASDAMTALIKEWDWAANGGLAPSNFAANTDFTPTAWRTEEWIYIYDGYGTDHPSKNGFSIIPLPWNKDQRESNLAQDFCDYITAQIMLPLGALLTCLFVGWVVKKQTVSDEFTNHGTSNRMFFSLWMFAVRVICPLSIIAIFLHQLGII